MQTRRVTNLSEAEIVAFFGSGPIKPHIKTTPGFPDDTSVIIDRTTFNRKLSTFDLCNSLTGGETPKHLTAVTWCDESFWQLIRLGARHIHRTCLSNPWTSHGRQAAITEAILDAEDAVDATGSVVYGTIVYASNCVNDVTFHTLKLVEERGMRIVIATSDVGGHTSSVMLSTFEVWFLPHFELSGPMDCQCQL